LLQPGLTQCHDSITSSKTKVGPYAPTVVQQHGYR
jgi:hypothetical protein